MRNGKVPLVALGAYLALIGVFALTSSGPAYSQGNGLPPGADVRVINKPAEPVPVILQGTTQIETSMPLPITDVNNPALERVQFNNAVILQEGEARASMSLGTIPQGKMLVIEHVSAFASLPQHIRPVLTLDVVQSNLAVQHFIAFTQLDDIVDTSLLIFSEAVASQPVRLYGDPGTEVMATFTRRAFTESTATCRVTISGHLVAL